MNKEAPQINEQEKELTLEDVEKYFKDELNFYSSKAGFEKEKRLPAGVRELYNQRLVLAQDAWNGFENKDYSSKPLEYIELILGENLAPTRKYNAKLDLITRKVYTKKQEKERNQEVEGKESLDRKIYLRKLAEKLAIVAYPQKEVGHIDVTKIMDLIKLGKDFCKQEHRDAEKCHQKGDYEDVLCYIDHKIAKFLKEKHAGADTAGAINEFRKYRTYFMGKEKEIKEQLNSHD